MSDCIEEESSTTHRRSASAFLAFFFSQVLVIGFSMRARAEPPVTSSSRVRRSAYRRTLFVSLSVFSSQVSESLGVSAATMSTSGLPFAST